jgi:hypothetical protein
VYGEHVPIQFAREEPVHRVRKKIAHHRLPRRPGVDAVLVTCKACDRRSMLSTGKSPRIFPTTGCERRSSAIGHGQFERVLIDIAVRRAHRSLGAA